MAMNCNIDTYWMNFGYWEKRRDDKEGIIIISGIVIFPQACSRMAGKLAEAVNMQPGNRCLDIGFGCGDQDIWWHQHYGVDIIAVEVVPSQVAVAKRRVRDLGLEKRVQLMLGSADDLNFARATFDKIVSLDSAYHYRTREVFFSKAYALLRPGGSLGLIDFVFNNRKSSLLQELVKTCASKFFLVPKVNMVSMDTYALQMKSAGFCNVRIVDLSEHVFNGFYEYSVNQYKKYSGLIAPRAFIQLRLVGMAIKFVGRYTNIKCILATGDKLSSK
ncbi:uncharacterized protein TRIADDRAFT_56090 [Trichoplax adhaerens]|uniref:phosphoethanolamine N-methyltransferase n=1 Tax=Trichoplax adhaerens TaxID=10228 RepID=B3RTY6_TRIAD|nr:hypothetical protein TRIADDRAFT_56090 [Trichoplax adhaerens]EDV26217.1 hypothetical protein TRIADDRAFT_56090 [Trichoplax adhaerens]|eukprot:XP_002112250.1 hypothetical protein TRIADDRAFT_56090 [Trichoplax adhaerens]